MALIKFKTCISEWADIELTRNCDRKNKKFRWILFTSALKIFFWNRNLKLLFPSIYKIMQNGTKRKLNSFAVEPKKASDDRSHSSVIFIVFISSYCSSVSLPILIFSCLRMAIKRMLLRIWRSIIFLISWWTKKANPKSGLTTGDSTVVTRCGKEKVEQKNKSSDRCRYHEVTTTMIMLTARSNCSSCSKITICFFLSAREHHCKIISTKTVSFFIKQRSRLPSHLVLESSVQTIPKIGGFSCIFWPTLQRIFRF